MNLHIATSNTFTRPFFAFVDRRFGLSDHEILSWALKNEWPEQHVPCAHYGTWFLWLYKFAKLSRRADRIIIHNLNNPRIALLLFFQPWLLKKCYWLIWGSDLYTGRLGKRTLKWLFKEFFRRRVIKDVGNLVSFVPGDVALAKEWYDAKGVYHQCLMYPSNLFQGTVGAPKVSGGPIRILIGNSADPSNNHSEILQGLEAFAHQNVELYAPLSYGGDGEYAEQVSGMGKALFDGKFFAMRSFMPRNEYQEFLHSIDIAVFKHRRQQAMGNTINLIGLGKKVYMARGTTLWDLFESLGLKIFDAENVNIDPISDLDRAMNCEIVRRIFNEDEMAKQYANIFR